MLHLSYVIPNGHAVTILPFAKHISCMEFQLKEILIVLADTTAHHPFKTTHPVQFRY